MSNVFSFTGTCVRDSEVRYAQSGLAVLNVTVANNIGFGDKKQTLWIRVALFGKRAEGQLASFLVKGQSVFVSGELTTRDYDKDGQTKTSLELTANIIDLIGKKTENEPARQPQPTQQQRATGGQSQHNQQKSNGYAPQGAAMDDDSEIPF